MNRRSDPHRLTRGTTLIEILAATMVLVILSAVLVAAVQQGRRTARDVLCRSHLSRLAIATGSYANGHNGHLFTNRATPLQISNVVYHSPDTTGWGELYPRYVGNYHVLFCPSDPGRSPTWEYGWSNWFALPETEPPDDPEPPDHPGRGHHRGWTDPRPDRGRDHWPRLPRGLLPSGRHRGWTDPQPDHGRDDGGHNPQGRGPSGRPRGWSDPHPDRGRDDAGHNPQGFGPRRRRRWPPRPGPTPTPVASEVQCSYGYRGRQGIVPDADAPFTVTAFDEHPQRVLGCDFYEPFFDPPRVHHRGHINVLRINGQVERVDRIVSFGPRADDFQTALDALDRTSQSLQQEPADPPGRRRRPPWSGRRRR